MSEERIIAIDTHVLIWGIKKEAIAKQVNMIQRTEKFLSYLQENKCQVIVPAPVLCEFLIGFPVDEQPKVFAEIQNNFMVFPFDALAALKSASIWTKNIDNVLPTNFSRQKLKIDNLIVAVAVANNASAIYSQDDGVKKFASGFIEVKDIPLIESQLEAVFPPTE